MDCNQKSSSARDRTWTLGSGNLYTIHYTTEPNPYQILAYNPVRVFWVQIYEKLITKCPKEIWFLH